MFPYPLSEQMVFVGDLSIRLLQPNPVAIQQAWAEQRAKGSDGKGLYWGRLWPASIGLARWVAANPQWVSGKQVLELAAGLGLPSLAAAHWARSVICTDLVPEAAAVAAHSATLNGWTHFSSRPLDWNDLPDSLRPDVVLLSDINYEPEVFATLHKVLDRLLNLGCTLLLSTPQRLMAKPFIEHLLPWCVQQHVETVLLEGKEHPVSLYVLASSAEGGTEKGPLDETAGLQFK